MKIAMSTNDDQAPPAKQRKLDADSSVNGRKAKAKRIEYSYASKVSRRLYWDTETADVFFTFEDSSERVSAHRCVLANASKVFRALLYGEEAPKGDVLLSDTPTEAFKIVLKFCYLDEVKLKPNQVANVMKLLDRYGMTECLESCGHFWADNWNVDSICSIYSYAINSTRAKLQEFCESKISAHSDAVFQTDGFLACSYNVLDRILSLNSLMSNESSKLDACLKWAQMQCERNFQNPNKLKNLRAQLGDVPNKIRRSSGKDDFILKHWNMLKSTESSRKLEECKKQVEYIFPKKELCREINATCSMVNVLETNRAISFFGLYYVRMTSRDFARKFFPIRLSIRELQKNGVSKVIHEERLAVQKLTTAYVRLQPKPVHMKPNCQYHIEFGFEPELKIRFVDEVADSTLEYKDLNIQIRPEGKAVKCLIKGLKFKKMK